MKLTLSAEIHEFLQSCGSMRLATNSIEYKSEHAMALVSISKLLPPEAGPMFEPWRPRVGVVAGMMTT